MDADSHRKVHHDRHHPHHRGSRQQHRQPIGTLEHLDPALLDIGDNVRDDAALSKSFIASIAENGVLVPITGVRDPENADVVRVRNGQRRTLAAREVGLRTVPVYVLPAGAADASVETIERIVHQIVTNDQKQDLTDAQRARGIQQMIDCRTVSDQGRQKAFGR